MRAGGGSIASLPRRTAPRETPLAKQSLLVADADPRSLRILDVALRKAGFQVSTAIDGAEALRRVQRATPDLVICELTLPGQDGASVCAAVRADARIAGLPFLVMSANRDPEARLRALTAGADDFLLKPILIKDLAARIRMLLVRREQQKFAQRGGGAALTGIVGELGLVDLFQSLEGWQRSAVAFCEWDERTAQIWVRDGQVIDAELGPLLGEAAFYRLLHWEGGTFRVEFGPVEREARIELGTQGLLLEAMRRVDEIARAFESLPGTTVLRVDFNALSVRLAELPDEVNGVIRLVDGQRTLAQLIEVSPVDDLSTLSVALRLLGEGVLQRGAAPSLPPAPRGKPSLRQWLGEASEPPPPRREPEQAAPEQAAPHPAEVAATALEVQATFARADAQAVFEVRAQTLPEVPGPITASFSLPAKLRASVPVVRFPPLRGVRRERLRQEAEQAREALLAGRPIRLAHVIELPDFPADAAKARRQISPAVNEVAKRCAPDVPVASLTQIARAIAGAAAIAQPAIPAPAPAESAVPVSPTAEAAAPAVVAVPETAAAVASTPAPELRASESSPTAVEAGAAPLAVVAVQPAASDSVPAPEMAPVQSSALPASAAAAAEDEFEAEIRAALKPRRRWLRVVGVATATASLIWFFRPQPRTGAPAAAAAKSIASAQVAPPAAPQVQPAATPAAASREPAPPPALAAPHAAVAPAAIAAQTAPKPAAAVHVVPVPVVGAAGHVVAPGPQTAVAGIGGAPAPEPVSDPYQRALGAGEDLLKRAKYRAAVGEFKRAVQLNPESVPALLALGDAYLEADLPRNAVKPLEKAAKIDLKSGRAQLLLGTAYQSQSRNADAVLAYQRYLELEPTGEFAHDVRSILANLKN